MLIGLIKCQQDQFSSSVEIDLSIVFLNSTSFLVHSAMMIDVGVQSGMERIKANIMSQVKKGRMKQPAAEKVLKLAKGTLTYDEFGSVDMVIEAAIEDIKLKQQVRLWQSISGSSPVEVKHVVYSACCCERPMQLAACYLCMLNLQK